MRVPAANQNGGREPLSVGLVTSTIEVEVDVEFKNFRREELLSIDVLLAEAVKAKHDVGVARNSRQMRGSDAAHAEVRSVKRCKRRAGDVKMKDREKGRREEVGGRAGTVASHRGCGSTKRTLLACTTGKEGARGRACGQEVDRIINSLPLTVHRPRAFTCLWLRDLTPFMTTFDEHKRVCVASKLLANRGRSPDSGQIVRPQNRGTSRVSDSILTNQAPP
ncbi:hypothetical protein ANO11243_079760 [Dothideomycetidae sp. 11243]|nr:hypothetical protein ANO11243_079760 [fungal sp. No.11243]